MKASRTRRLVGVAAAILLATGAAVFGTGAARAASSTGDVYVVHGIVGSTVDIFIDGRDVAPAAAPKTVVGALKLSAGSHVVTLKEGANTLVSAKFTVRAGRSIDVVAHRTADASRSPVITVFANDLSPVTPGKVRLVVSHTAVAPPADIRVDGSPLFRNVANGESLMLVVPAMQGTIDIVPTATTGPAILAPVMLRLMPGTLTRIFAIGDSTAGTTDAVVQILPVGVVGSARPTKVQTGDGGQTADSIVGSGPGLPTYLAVLTGFGLLVAAGRRASSGHSVIGSRHAR